MAIDKNDVVSLYESGMTPGEIANRFGVTPGAVSHILTRSNIARRVGRVKVLRIKTTESRRAYFQAQYKQAVEFYHDGWDISEIMQYTGLAKSTLVNYFSKHGIKRNTRAQIEKYKHALSYAAKHMGMTVEQLLELSESQNNKPRA